MLRQTQQFSCRHFDQCQHLAALGDQCVVLWARDPECTPEPRSLCAIQPAFNHQLVTEPCRAPIIDLSPGHNRIGFLLRHLHDGEPELLRQVCASDLDETQIRDVGYNASAVGVEKHHLHVCANTGSHGQFHIFNLN